MNDNNELFENDKSENPNISKKEGNVFCEMYKKYNDTLRTWFVAFGLGGLYLLVTNKELIASLKIDKTNKIVEWSFLIGVASQIIGALINKFINWLIYCSTIVKDFHKRRIYKIADKFSEFIWFDLIMDLITIVCFSIVFWIMILTLG